MATAKASSSAASIEAVLQQAKTLAASAPSQAAQRYDEIIRMSGTGLSASDSAALLRAKEEAIQRLGEILQANGNAQELATFVRSLEGDAWKVLPRAKTARLLRFLLDLFAGIKKEGGGESTQVAVKLCSELVAWSRVDNRAFLRLTLEFRLASLYLDSKMYSDALALVGQLLRELKRMEDKLTLVEVHLLECRIYFVLRNGPKAKAALTAARSNANSIYCPPLIQAALDMQSALVHADEDDFKTAYSYFIEALEGYAGQDDPRGATALKYLMLCKIMMDQADDLDALIAGKTAQRYAANSKEVEAMKAVGIAYKHRSLEEFETALGSYPEQLGTDPMIHAHFQRLYDQLLQKNLLQIIQPYSHVQLSFISEAIKLPIDVVESKYASTAGDNHVDINIIIARHL